MDNLVNEELLMKLNKDFENAEELLKVIDPKETPFESKYKARTILKEIIEKLNNYLSDDTRSHCQALIGGLFSQIGTIGKRHALKIYDQFTLNTSCFWGSTRTSTLS